MSDSGGESGRKNGLIGNAGQDDREAWLELRAAKEYAEAIVEALHEPLLVLTPDLHVKSANSAFYEHFQVTPAETEGEPIYRLGNDQWDIPELRTLLEDVLPDNNVVNDFEITHEFKDIGVRTMLVNARRLDHVQLILVGIRDITERKKIENALRENQVQLRLIADAMPALLSHIDVELRYRFANKRYEQWYGRTPDEIVGMHLREFLGDAAFENIRCHAEAALAGQRQSFEAEMPYSLGGTRHVQLEYVPNVAHDGSVVGFYALITDVTKHKQVEEELRELNETLETRVRERTEEVRMLASRVLLAEQRERERIAQLLHDDVQQTLHALHIRINNLAAQQGIARDDEKLDEAFKLLRSAVRGTRSLSAMINPSVLRHGGLGDALRWLAEHIGEWHDLRVDVQVDVEGLAELDEPRTLLAFHSARELLFNVAKHARVQRAVLAARLERGELVIEVMDEGGGFDPEEVLARKPTTFGLATIRERVRFHGGELEIDSAPGKGTRQTLRIPITS